MRLNYLFIDGSNVRLKDDEDNDDYHYDDDDRNRR